MKFRALIAGALALALAGCGGLSSLGTSTPAQANTVAAAEIAYTKAANLETLWLQSGKATAAQAKFAKNLEAAVYDDVVAGRTAVANGDSAAIKVALKLFNQALPEFSGYIVNHGGQP